MAKIQLLYFDLDTGYYPNLHHGLAYVIAALRHAKNEVFLSHLKNESDYIDAIELYKKESPNILGLSFTTNQKKHVRNFLNKFSFLGKFIIGGGIHCTIIKEKVFDDFPEIRGICIGEGELPLISLCQKIDKNEDYLHTPSFYFKINTGIVKNDLSPLQPIDSLPLPDYSLFSYEKIVYDNGFRFPMMISRGCPYNCSYCCNHALRESYSNKDTYVRFATPVKAIAIIKNNLRLCPQTKKIVFSDDTFTLNKPWLTDFCSLYKKEIGLPFICNARIETICSDIVTNLKDAGCESLDFGVESGNAWLRKHVLNRKYSNAQIKDALKIVKAHKIKIGTYNMYGLPFETKKMMEDTLNLNIELRPDYGKCFYFFPYPGTKIYQLCVDYGLLLENLDSSSGYLEAPSLQEIFSTHAEIRKYYEATQLYFYLRILSSKFKLPIFLEILIFKVIFLLSRPIFIICDPLSKNRLVTSPRKLLRRLILKYFR